MTDIQDEIEGHPALACLLADIVRQAFGIEVTLVRRRDEPTQVLIGRLEDE